MTPNGKLRYDLIVAYRITISTYMIKYILHWYTSARLCLMPCITLIYSYTRQPEECSLLTTIWNGKSEKIVQVLQVKMIKIVSFAARPTGSRWFQQVSLMLTSNLSLELDHRPVGFLSISLCAYPISKWDSGALTFPRTIKVVFCCHVCACVH